MTLAAKNGAGGDPSIGKQKGVKVLRTEWDMS